MEKLYTVSKRRPGADCGSDHELLIAKFRLKLKKVGNLNKESETHTHTQRETNKQGERDTHNL